MKVVVIGNGLLGKEIVKLSKWDCISRSTHDFDFRDITTVYQYLKDYDIIINCVAHTDTYSNERELHWAINYKAVSRLTDWCNENDKKLVHISTDYVYANSSDLATEADVPVHANNWYSYTKLLADGYVQAKSNNYLLIRTSFKEKPFPYLEAFRDLKGNFDYVDVISEKIIKLIELDASGVFNIGTSFKTMLELALKTKSDVKSISKENHYTYNINTTIDTGKYEKHTN